MIGVLVAACAIVAATGVAWWLLRHRAIATDALAYPVLLVDENMIAEVCFDADELTLRPENQDHVIEQRFYVVDAFGARFRIENYRQAEPRPSTLRRVFSATVYNVHSFRVAFELRPDGQLERAAVIELLRDREWTLPDGADTAPLTELYIAYRADRWREYGNSRDRMP